jgi:3-oxoacyl-[acyl-carrier-protein] synthase-3
MAEKRRNIVGIRNLSYYLPEQRVSIEELARKIQLSDERLKTYQTVRRLKCVRMSDETAGDMAVKVGGQVLHDSRMDGREIDAVVFFHSLYNMSLAPTNLVGRIQHDLGLSRSISFAVSGQGCAAINSAIRVSRDMILAGSAETVLVIGADGMQDSRSRELNGISVVGDGASAMILQKGCTTNRFLEISSFDEGYFHCVNDWDKKDQDNFDLVYMIASARLVQRTLARANLSLDQISLLIPHNVNYSSWERIISLLKFDPDRFFGENIAINGHAYGTDVVVNLADAIAAGRVRKGDYVMLMSAGMGTLGCAIIQH